MKLTDIRPHLAYALTAWALLSPARSVAQQCLLPGPNSSLAFDGDDSAYVPNYAAVNNLSAFTVECWLRTERATGWAVLIQKWSGFDISLLADGRLEGITSSCQGCCGRVRTNGSVTDGLWHHVAFVSTGSSISIFLDGTLHGSGNYRAKGCATTGISFGVWRNHCL